MRKRKDVNRSEIARKAIVKRLEALEGPVGYYASATELKDMIKDAGIDLDEIPVEKAIAHYRKAKELEWKRTFATQAN